MDRLMTRKEKEKVLLDGLGLKVGDKIILINCSKHPLKIIEKNNAFSLYRECDDLILKIDILLKEEFKKYIEPKKYKDMICTDLGINTCSACPLIHICTCGLDITHTVQEQLDNMQLDNEERKFYQKRIDREYKEK